MKKFMSVVLSVCMILMFAAPVFANEFASKVALSDPEMLGAVGGAGGFDSTITTWDRTTGQLQAVVANRWQGSNMFYSVDILQCTGGGTDPIATLIPATAIGANTVKIIIATVPTAYRGNGAGYCARVKLYGGSSYPGILAQDMESL
jgi:hypothetical protein